MMISPNMEVLEINPRMQEWFPEADYGEHPFCHSAFNYPAQNEVCKDCPVQKTLRDGQVHVVERELLTSSGIRFLRMTSTAITAQDGEVVAAIEVVDDFTDHKRAEEELEQSLAKLKRTLEEAVNALASVTELRDPYTAGHQQRATRLAVAIATEMGAPQEQIDGIRVAGAIHDVGKIYIPAEILSKPSKLTEIEFRLIKEHSQAGYDILKSVEFPWPVAQIVLQHHERLNGSGYPKGLQGEDIMLEAKILSVADVVEAMASHRPYRPSLGIDQALDEISKNSGILYDPQVVDVCCRLFHEKEFNFQ
jgi:HD-GYP domain-containing protein (c-di-GMP phosphodiesterase class II)